MDDTDVVMFEGEDFQVVDECDEEEEQPVLSTNVEPSNETTTEATNPVNDEISVEKQVDDAECTIIEKSVESEEHPSSKEYPSSEVQPIQVPIVVADDNSIDFTADIDLENLDTRKDDVTDEDVMNHLDDIENIVIDTSSSDVQIENEKVNKEPVKESSPIEIITDGSSVKEKDQTIESKNDLSTEQEEKSKDKSIEEQELMDTEDTDKKEESSKEEWYKEKIDAKVTTVKERLSKLARVLEFSYPCYKNWLDKNEALTGTPVCRLQVAQCYSLEKPHINRWKFICSRKPVQESTEKDKEDSAAAATVDKNVQTVWRLEPSGASGANIDNSSEFPPFVVRAVKIFEDFLQTTDQSSIEESASDNKIDEITINTDDTTKNMYNITEDTDEMTKDIGMITNNDANESSKSLETLTNDEKESANDNRQQWLWLLVRCNRMDELMLFATGKNINSATMDRLKQVFETGPGKDCKVKSLYCKSIVKAESAHVSTTTFLVGSEALEETVGGIKIQLAPKTNFWSNAAGAETLGKAVANLLAPTLKTTVVEIGCGIGLIGLMLASKCQQVIGIDLPSEVEEAEMTSELNNIKNASFVMGQPSEVMATIANIVANCKGAAIINANTNIGRAIEVMTSLRKMISLRKLVMVTTLTKQSVRAILELTRPADEALGNPFMPIRACVVDTLPVGPHFEVVILMERRMMHKLTQPWVSKAMPKSATQLTTQPASGISSGQGSSPMNPQSTSNLNKKEIVLTKVIDHASPSQKFDTSGIKVVGKVSPKKGKNAVKNGKAIPPKGNFKGKRLNSPGKTFALPKKFGNKVDKPNFKSKWRANKFSEQKSQNKNLQINPFRKQMQGKTSPLLSRDGPQKRRRSWSEEMRDCKETIDLRERLSGGRMEPDIIEKVKKQQVLLELAKEKLSGSGPNVDVTTAKQLQSMLSMVIEQTNQIQNQLPRSVWDRIAPPDNDERTPAGKLSQDDHLLKGRYIQETGEEEILITAENIKFSPGNPVPKINYSKYNIPPLRPNLVMPIASDDSEYCFQERKPKRFRNENYRKQNQGNQWIKGKPIDKTHWEDVSLMKKMGSPPRRKMSPFRNRMSPMRSSPKRPLLSPPRRPSSPPRRFMSPPRRAPSPFRYHVSPPRRQMSPPRRQMSPPRRQMSPNRRLMSPPRRLMSPMKHQLSPTRQDMSQSRRQLSPPRRHMSPQRRGISPPRRLMSPQRVQMPSPRRVTDEWDIPSRGAIEQDNWQQQRPNEQMPDKRWNTERQMPPTSNWDQSMSKERYRNKPITQDKWDMKDSSQEGLWMSGGGNIWNSKQTSVKPSTKEQQSWQYGSDNSGRWQNMPQGQNPDWNIRGKESFARPASREKEPWTDNNKPRWESMPSKEPWSQTDKDGWNDLPDDAKDPWGDDGNCGVKERWQKFDNPSTSSGWMRDSDIGDMRSKPSDNWQNKGPSGNNAKPSWPTPSNQNANESRWFSSTDVNKKIQPPGTWQTGSNVTPIWPPSNFMGFQQQRNFNPNPFKR